VVTVAGAAGHAAETTAILCASRVFVAGVPVVAAGQKAGIVQEAAALMRNGDAGQGVKPGAGIFTTPVFHVVATVIGATTEVARGLPKVVGVPDEVLGTLLLETRVDAIDNRLANLLQAAPAAAEAAALKARRVSGNRLRRILLAPPASQTR